jgi:hypothetical protein
MYNEAATKTTTIHIRRRQQEGWNWILFQNCYLLLLTIELIHTVGIQDKSEHTTAKYTI